MEDPVIPASPAVAGLRAVAVPTHWKLWTEPAPYIVYWSACVLTALGLTVVVAIAVPPRPGDVGMLLVLSALGVGQAELGRKIERMRRLIDATPHINLTSVWTFAGVLLLPPALTFTLIGLLYLHLALRSWHGLRATPPYRTVINVCNTALSCYAGYQVLAWSGVGGIRGALGLGWASIGGIAAAIAIYFLIAAAITIPGLKPADHTLTELFGGWVDNILEVLTLLTAVVVALILVSPLPYLVITIVALLVFVHRGVLYKQMEILASTDEKTGLFNLGGWHSLAADALAKAQRENAHGAVLMADLDHFKKVNDTFGHLAGDAVLKAVADVLRDNVRDYDAVGRLGGEEFVILLPDIAVEDAMRVAERIRQAVSTRVILPAVTLDGRKAADKDRTVSISIGVAAYPDKGFVIDTLLGEADTALYVAKAYGRNQVRLATTA
jgi:diguanylate cyclase (GGDEF)-like protein